MKKNRREQKTGPGPSNKTNKRFGFEEIRKVKRKPMRNITV
jgi:hypothetical protein